MAKIVGLPKLSPTMEEGTLAKWVKKEGDTIEIDDLVAEIETDKATMEWRSFDKAVLLKILAPEGTTLEPDQPVAVFGRAGEDITSLLAELGDGKAAVTATTAPAEPKAAPVPEAPAVVSPKKTGDGRVLASPLVRQMAREHELDLGGVQGTGPGGRIIKRDIDAVLANGRAGAKALTPMPVGARLPPIEQPLTQMRKTIARRLVESKQTVPHFYLTIDVDADPILEARTAINASLEKAGEKISINDLLIKACAAALRRVPATNRSFAGDRILQHQVVDISVAVAVPDGLLTPVVRDADRKGVAEIGREVRDLAARARDKKLKPEEMSGGTFSISNLGMYGIEDFSAVINPPEGAILAVGAVREEPVVSGGHIVAGRRMRMTLSCDHRVVDGAIGAEYLDALRRILVSPIIMLS